MSQSQSREKVLERYRCLRSETGTARLQEVLTLAMVDRKEAWVLRELQSCPRCLMLARRHDGCPHLVCRCGCHFCFGCGAPHMFLAGEEFGCLCDHQDEYDERPRLA